MEQIRVIKEMRDADIRRGRTGVSVRPRFMVWENVPGAFSSNGGEDFRAVLEETIRVAEPDAPDLPLPPKGKWPLADAWYGDGWSVAYRVLDAQFWGVPQRRRRIALVADLGGWAAPEILFVRKGVQGDIDESGTAREEAARGAGGGADRAISFQERAGKPGGGKGILIQHERTGALSTLNNQSVLAFKAGQGSKTGSIGAQEECSPTLSAVASGTNQVPAVCYSKGTRPHSKDEAQKWERSECVNTLNAFDTGEQRCSELIVTTALCVGNGQTKNISMAEQANTLDTMHDQQAIMCAAVDCRNGRENPKINGTLQANSNGGVSYNLKNVCRQNGIVRRLTPLECERLQGYPDGWTDIGEWTDSKGKRHKDADSPRYKALGNSIALPAWKWVLKRISAQYERDATLGSLFDGIGGFPLLWEQINGKGTALWASEIEEFPIAVTRARFG